MAEDLNDLAAFALVAEARSFTKAAARLSRQVGTLSMISSHPSWIIFNET